MSARATRNPYNMSHVPRAAFTDLPDVLPDSFPKRQKCPRTVPDVSRVNEWMRRYSWLVAMTVAIVIAVRGLVILESGRMRIAAECEMALETKTATARRVSINWRNRRRRTRRNANARSTRAAPISASRRCASVRCAR